MVQTNHEPMPTGGMEVTVIYGGHGFEVDLLMRHYMEGCCMYHSDFVMSYAPGLRISLPQCLPRHDKVTRLISRVRVALNRKCDRDRQSFWAVYIFTCFAGQSGSDDSYDDEVWALCM
jgi:hypothetical protein